MSTFVKRNTINPAGGINPASSPNVGQFGWTKYDAANVNQIQQYVNMCKQYAQESKDAADYVSLKFEELKDFMTFIEKVYVEIKPIYDNIIPIYNDIKIRHDDIIRRHDDIIRLNGVVQSNANDAKTSADSALASKEAAGVSANNAKISETNAAKSAKDAADIAAELRKGQVYRGTWNMEANSDYPPVPDTNSVWDVILNEGNTTGVTVNGKLWYWGDRLIYVKDPGEWFQVESGSNVISVNGKAGAVTLDYTDVGAAPAGYGLGETAPPKKETAPEITHSGFYHASLGAIGGDTNSLSCHLIVNSIDATNKFKLYAPFDDNKVWFKKNDNTPVEFYTTANKPTTADVGAVSRSGDTMTGPLRFNSGQKGASVYTNKASALFQDEFNNTFHQYAEGNFLKFGAGTNGETLLGGLTNTGEWTGSKFTSFNTGKSFQTPGGSIVSGSDYVTLEGKRYAFVSAPDDVHLCHNAYWNGSSWGKYDNSKSSGKIVINQLGLKWITSRPGSVTPDENTFDIYTSGNKPTAADIGALPVTGGNMQGSGEIHWPDSNASLTNRDNQFLNLEGGTHVVVTTGRRNSDGTAYLGKNFYYEGGWKKFNNAKDSGVLEISGKHLTYFQSDEGSDNPIQRQYKVYHEGNKPTATDFGSIPVYTADRTGGDGSALNVFSTLADVGTGSSTFSFLISGGDNLGQNTVPLFKVSVNTRGDTGSSTPSQALAKVTLLEGSDNPYVSFYLVRDQGWISFWVYRGGFTSQMSVIPLVTDTMVSHSYPMTVAASVPDGEGKVNIPLSVSYTSTHKPTATDVGALSLSGGTVSGAIRWDSDIYINSAKKCLYLAANADKVFIEGKENPMARVNKVDYLIYHQGFKPNAADVGAVPLTGNSEINGTVLVHGSVYKKGPGDFIIADQKGVANREAQFYNTDGTLNLRCDLNSDSDSAGQFAVYASNIHFRGSTIHANASINANRGINLTGTGSVLSTIGGYIRSNQEDVMSFDGKHFSFVTAPNDAHLCGNAYSDGRMWLKYNNSRPSAYAVCGVDGEFHVFTSVAGNSNPQQIKALNLSNDGNLTVAGKVDATTHCVVDSPDKTRAVGIESPHGFDPYISIDRKYKAFEFRTNRSIFANYGVRNGIDRIVDGTNDVWNQFHQEGVCAFTYGINGTSGSFSVNQSNGAFEWRKTLSTINGNGDYVISGTGYAAGGWLTGSDERFKTEIRPLALTKDSWLDKVCSLNAKSFKYKTSDNTSVGFIAQDIQAVIPEAVTEQQVITSESEHQDDFKDRLFIDPMAIIAAQNEAIKELAAMNKSLLARIEVLEEKSNVQQ